MEFYGVHECNMLNCLASNCVERRAVGGDGAKRSRKENIP